MIGGIIMKTSKKIKTITKDGSYTINTEIDEVGNIKETITLSSENIKLFRYRGSSERHLSALLNNEIWASQPITFNDPYDMYLNFNIKKILSKSQESDKLLSKKNVLREIKGFTNNQIRKMSYVASFSTLKDSTTMWAHYADNAKGFVLEYSIKQLRDIAHYFMEDILLFYEQHFGMKRDELNAEIIQKWKDLHTGLYPVRYLVNGSDFTDEMLKYKEQEVEYPYLVNSKEELLKSFEALNDENLYNENKSMILHMVTTKSKHWTYEKEWRLFLPNPFSGPEHLVVGDEKPTGIYMGEKVSNTNKILICLYAKKHGIPVYQMITKYVKKASKLGSYKLSPEEIENIISLNFIDDFKLT